MPQSLSSVVVHLVFSTKHREPLIAPDVEPELHPYMATILRNAGCPSLAINGTADHIHALLFLSRTIAVSEVVEVVKRDSSKWIKTRGPKFQNFYWQTGYGAFSVGHKDIDTAKAYIAEQKEHHRTRSFQEEYRAFLKRYGITYDERYVWD